MGSVGNSAQTTYTEYDDVTLRTNARFLNRLQCEQRTLERAQKVVRTDIEKEQRMLQATVTQCRLQQRERIRAAEVMTSQCKERIKQQQQTRRCSRTKQEPRKLCVKIDKTEDNVKGRKNSDSSRHSKEWRHQFLVTVCIYPFNQMSNCQKDNCKNRVHVLYFHVKMNYTCTSIMQNLTNYSSFS